MTMVVTRMIKTLWQLQNSHGSHCLIHNQELPYENPMPSPLLFLLFADQLYIWRAVPLWRQQINQRNRCKCVQGVQCSKPHPRPTDLKFNMIPRVSTKLYITSKTDKQREECYITTCLLSGEVKSEPYLLLGRRVKMLPFSRTKCSSRTHKPMRVQGKEKKEKKDLTKQS